MAIRNRLPVAPIASLALAGALAGLVALPVNVRAEDPAPAAQESPKPLVAETAKTDSAAQKPAEAAKSTADASKSTETPKPAATAAQKPAASTAPKSGTSEPIDASKSAETVKPMEPAKSAANDNAKPAPAKPVSTTSGKTAAVKSTPQPGRSRPSGAGVQVATQVEERTSYHYNTLGRRDPFESLVENFVGEDVGGNGPVDIGGIRVVGIVWGTDPFALVEDGRGNSGILRRGDKVMNGFVEALQRDAVVVRLSVDGQSQTVSIPLIRKEENSNASR